MSIPQQVINQVQISIKEFLIKSSNLQEEYAVLLSLEIVKRASEQFKDPLSRKLQTEKEFYLQEAAKQIILDLHSKGNKQGNSELEILLDSLIKSSIKERFLHDFDENLKGWELLNEWATDPASEINKHFYLRKVRPENREKFEAYYEELLKIESSQEEEEIDEPNLEDVYQVLESLDFQGSPKQVKWAKDIALKNVSAILLKTEINQIPISAKWWIDNRNDIYNALQSI